MGKTDKTITRTELPIVEGEEQKVIIDGSDRVMSRLRYGASAYAAGLRELIGFGGSTPIDPNDVEELGNALDAAEKYHPPESEYPKRERATVTAQQADLAHIVAATIFAGMEKAYYEKIATAWDDDRWEHSHGWHVDPVQIWRGIEEGLRPPEEASPPPAAAAPTAS